MSSDDLTIRILQEMRDEMRGLREDNRDFRVELHAIREDMRAGFDAANVRFEVIETTLRDVAEQLVMQSRAIRVALEGRAANDQRFDDHERRIADLERKSNG